MSVLKGLFAALGAYWLVVFWRRWSIHARTQQFVLEQRRKAGIPDSDKRPLAEAAADAAQRRQRAFEEQLKECQDVFGRAQPAPQRTVPKEKPGKAVRASRAPSHEPAPPAPPAMQRNRTITRSNAHGHKRAHSDADGAAAKRNRTAPAKATDTEAPRKRHAEDEPPRTRKAARKEPVDDDEEMADVSGTDLSDSSQPYDSDAESMDEEDELVPGDEHGPRKREADTTMDHGPGDEWLDANGLRWRIGEDGIPRRLVTLVEMKPKYRMPRDATHADSKTKVPTYIEKFLSHDEYEEAKRKKQLSWQHELALAKNTDAGSPMALASDDNVEDSLASLVSRRSKAQLRRTGGELLYNDATRTPQQLARSRASSVAGDDSFGASMSDDSRSFSSSISANVSGDNLSASRRLALGRSPAPRASPHLLRAQRYAASPSPLSPARSALDQAAKRRREEQLMAQIRANREAKAKAAPKPGPPAPKLEAPAPPKLEAPAPAEPTQKPAEAKPAAPVFTFGK